MAGVGTFYRVSQACNVPGLRAPHSQPHFRGIQSGVLRWRQRKRLRTHINLGIMASDNSVCLCAKVCVCKIYTRIHRYEFTMYTKSEMGRDVSYGLVTVKAMRANIII